MNVLILAAGGRVSDPLRGDYPLWMAEVENELLIQRLVEACRKLKPTRFVFVARGDDVRDYHVDDIVRLLVGDSVVIGLKRETSGAACSALLAIDAVDPDAELLIANATDLVDADLEEVVQDFRARGAAAGTIVFDSLHPRYSFVRLDEQGFVTEAAEKRPISRNATTGYYWFRRARDFFEAAESMIAKDAHVGGSFYICPTLNELVLKQQPVVVWRIRPDQYHPFKNPQQVNAFEALLEHMRSPDEAQPAR